MTRCSNPDVHMGESLFTIYHFIPEGLYHFLLCFCWGLCFSHEKLGIPCHFTFLTIPRCPPNRSAIYFSVIWLMVKSTMVLIQMTQQASLGYRKKPRAT